MKSIDVMTSAYIYFDVENNDTHLEVKVGDNVGIWKHNSISAKFYIPYCSEDVFVMK